MAEILRVVDDLVYAYALDGFIWDFADFIGLNNEPMGGGSEMNTPLVVRQIFFALALKRDNPLVKELIKKGEEGSESFDANILAENKVLEGLKILDLGCGYKPTFARCARRLGAEVYTVDFISAEKFVVHKMGRWRKVEKENHISVDLNSSEAYDLILQKSEGNFDLVTSSQLESGAAYEGEYSIPKGVKSIAMALLKKGGFYFISCSHKVFVK